MLEAIGFLLLLGLVSSPIIGVCGWAVYDIWRMERARPKDEWSRAVDVCKITLDCDDDLRYAWLLHAPQQPPEMNIQILKQLKRTSSNVCYPVLYNNEGRHYRTVWEADYRKKSA